MRTLPPWTEYSPAKSSKEALAVRASARGPRLVTLTGPGGSGKTRLSLEVGRALRHAFKDGVWLVELAPVQDGGLVPQAIAAALGVGEERGRPLLGSISEHLEERRVLLLFDNCEHQVAACAVAAETLLRSCAGLHILTTSREPLGIAGETTWPVAPLAIPGASNMADPESLLEVASARLFVDRAQAAQPSFDVNADNADAIARICRRLDGIPLAVELAAVRIRAFSVEHIAARLDDALGLLRHGSRVAPLRHQTLQALLDWSYALLTDSEQRVFRGLSVFAGGWSLEAAEAVCGSAAPAAEDVLDTLFRLVDKSLVGVHDQQGQGRYRLLETIRQYAASQLESSPDVEVIPRRHRDWYLRLVELAAPDLLGPRESEWLERLELEHDNLRVALRWTIAQGEVDIGLRMGAALLRLWFVHGHVGEARRWLESILAIPGPSTATLRANVLHAAGVLAASQADHAFARSMAEASLQVRREVGDREGAARSLGNLGVIAELQGQLGEARRRYNQALAVLCEIGNAGGVATSLNNLGSLAEREGDYARAQSLHEEALAIREQIGDRQGIAASLNNLGTVAQEQGNYPAARALHERALVLRQELQDRDGTSASLANLGMSGADIAAANTLPKWLSERVF